ncbi:Kinetoplast-associated protein 1 [Leptomonas pyrrhocoris]|uniref:Kinetoplast-associated protein 1 n=1 Tax=Leptomonas pyrrhocoris TaxID=157538 RepID=A0A0N0VH14_LEPPY|nr:Kinetoplast-associated protein 1 [Leptomonas pyrrhocoris]KPA84461.1 Kinetoplast-associated protein 1 [Leptomonas pyrrhocoris]|eukprot:XP_015662900.1 Kinetoplast-associated protein 1 [Leptomonas pyrrhocoris]
MLRVTVRALVRKAPSKVGSKAATSTAVVASGAAPVPSIPSIRAVPPVGESKVSIPPIPGVRSARAMRHQQRAATRSAVGVAPSKRQPTRSCAKPAQPTKASRAIKKAANKARGLKKTVQHKVKTAAHAIKTKPKKLAKSLSKKSASKKAHK